MSKLKVCFGPIQNYFGLVKTIWMGLFGPTAGQVISKLQILIKLGYNIMTLVMILANSYFICQDL